jgi:tRNA (adenine37-N6)-methyltransferase
MTTTLALGHTVGMDIEMKEIGTVKSTVKVLVDEGWGDVVSEITLRPEYSGALTGLEDFSHAIIVYYMHRATFDPALHLIRRPQEREDMPEVGMFAQRARHRPNPIGVTAVEIVSIDGDTLTVRGLDAVDGTPVLDIKPYYPDFDKKLGSTPEWVDRLMKRYF